MDRPPFVMPTGRGAIDSETGYAIDLPLGPQDYPGWQKDKPEVVARIKKLRDDLKITVDDDQFTDKATSVNIRSAKKLVRSKKPKPGPKPAARRK